MRWNDLISVTAWGLACVYSLTYEAVWQPKHHEVPEPEQVVAYEEPIMATPAAEEDSGPYHPETIELYSVPLDHDLQAFIIRTCEEKNINPAIVIAMIGRESNFIADSIGDGGASVGLMQIQERYHRERMDKLGATDLLDPFQNVAVGIDYLVELHDKYDGHMEKALMAYNAGPSGAYKHWFSQGIYSNNYSKAVLTTSEDLKEGRRDADFQV